MKRKALVATRRPLNRFFVAAFCAFSSLSVCNADALNVLIVGSTEDLGDKYGSDSAAFDPTAIATELDSIISQNGPGNATVTVAERHNNNLPSGFVYNTATFLSDSYNLTGWFHYPLPAGSESNRWANLRGADGTVWDYVVIIGDPYTMEKTPGMYAQGVAVVAEEVAKGTAEPILLMNWPASTSSSTVAHYKEVVYRAGRSGGYKVAPAALAWQAAGSPSGGGHPNADGAYIAAASIFSRIYNQSASNSGYTYDDSMADTVHTAVTNNVGQPQYSGNFSFTNPYLMLGDPRRDVHFSERGTSTEEDFKNAAKAAMNRCGVTHSSIYSDKYNSNTPEDDGLGWPVGNEMPIAWNHGRSYPNYKKWVLNTNYWQLGFGYEYHWNTQAYSNEIANDHYIAMMDYYDTGRANAMLSDAAVGARWMPTRMLWAQMHKQYPTLDPMRDYTHLNWDQTHAVGTYMYTLYSGRCPLNPEPSPMTSRWMAQKIGYETAWRMGRCQTRAPGFKVLPTSATATDVTPTNAQTLSVQFIMAPLSNVTVTVTTDDRMAGKVTPSLLTFTPSNYTNAQTVTVLGESGLAGSYEFNVILTTSSADPVYEGVSDSWSFVNTRPVGLPPSDIQVRGNDLPIIPGYMTPETATGTDFGIVTASVAHVFTITNTSGSATVDLTNAPRVTLTGDPGAFTLTQDAATSTLSPNASTTFTVTYNAPGGLHTGLVSVASTDTNIPLYLFPLQGISPTVPTVANSAFTPTAGGATLQGLLTGGGAADAWICWGQSNGGASNTGAWENVESIGVASMGGPFSTLPSGLTFGRQYYYRCYATNTYGEAWAASTASFTAGPLSVDIANTTATTINQVDYTLNATLQATQAVFDAYLYWGETDGANIAGNWANTNYVGSYTNVASTNLSFTVNGLDNENDYFYRYMASNLSTNMWSAESQSFGLKKVNAYDYDYKIQITFTNFAGRGTLTNFPALVKFNTNDSFYAGFTSADAHDLRFCSEEDGSGILNYEIEAWNTNGESFVWVQIPELVNNGSIWAYWGRTGAVQPAYTANGATWSEGFVGTWHMNDTVTNSGTFVESAAGRNGTMTDAGSSATISGIAGNAVDFNGNSYITGSDQSAFNLGANITVSAWVQGAWPNGGWEPWVSKRGETTGWQLRRNAGDKQVAWTTRGAGGDFTDTTDPGLDDGEWHYVLGKLGGGRKEIYVDGELYAGEGNSGTISDTTENVCIGARLNGGPGAYSEASIDEVRISSVARSSNWVWACYQNQGTNHDSFMAYGSARPAVETIKNLAPTSVTHSNAMLNATLSSLGATNTVYVYWGETDGEDVAGNWANTNLVGTYTNVASTNLSFTAEGLTAETNYVYRFMASSAATNFWAPESESFNTPSYGYKMQITFTNFAGRGTLTNFPALVKFNTTSNFYARFASAEAHDLRFFSEEDRTGVLNYEIEAWNTNGESFVWVQIPELTNNCSIWAYWGTAGAVQPVYTTNGATWSEGHVGVWHMNDTVVNGGTFVESSAGRDGTMTDAGSSAAISGIAGNAVDFNGNSYITGSDENAFDLDANITVSAWVQGAWPGNWEPWVSKGNGEANGWQLRRNGTANQVAWTLGGANFIGATTNLADGEWHYVLGKLGGGRKEIYVDGELYKGANNSGTISDTTRNVCIGARLGGGGPTAYSEASIDEVRISSVARSSNWVWACYQNQGANHDSFVAYSPINEVNGPPPAPPVTMVRWGAPSREDIVTANTSKNATGTYDPAVPRSPTVGGAAGYYVTDMSNRTEVIYGAHQGLLEIRESGSADYAWLAKYMSIGDTMKAMLVWKKADFLTDCSATVTDFKLVMGGPTSLAYTNRWVVEKAGQFYISDQTFTTGSFDVDASTLTWREYTPLNSGSDTIGAAATVTLYDLGSIGFYINAECISGADGWRRPTFNYFAVDGDEDPDLSGTVNYVTYAAGPGGSISGSTTQEVLYGGSTTPVTAEPEPFFDFTGWSDGGMSNPRMDTNVVGGLNLVAAFARSQTELYEVPHAWMAAQHSAWTNDYEAAVMQDLDGDRFTTAEEYWGGTDPVDSNSFLKVEQILTGDNQARIEWTHAKVDPGLPPIGVQRRSVLDSGSWTNIGQRVPTDGTVTWDDPGASDWTGFYRLILINMPESP